MHIINIVDYMMTYIWDWETVPLLATYAIPAVVCSHFCDLHRSFHTHTHFSLQFAVTFVTPQEFPWVG